MNHLLLIIPVQPKGGLLSYRAMGCVYVCVRAPQCLRRARARHPPKAPNEGTDTAHVTDRVQVV